MFFLLVFVANKPLNVQKFSFCDKTIQKKYHIFMLRLKLKNDFCNKFC